MSEQSSDVVVCVPVAPGRVVDHSWGKAQVVATATVRDGAVATWTEDAVGWDVQHDVGPHGQHHARIARFLLDKGAHAVVASHMGPPMVNMLGKMGVVVQLGASGDAAAAVLAVAEQVHTPAAPVEPAEEDMGGC